MPATKLQPRVNASNVIGIESILDQHMRFEKRETPANVNSITLKKKPNNASLPPTTFTIGDQKTIARCTNRVANRQGCREIQSVTNALYIASRSISGCSIDVCGMP